MRCSVLPLVFLCLEIMVVFSTDLVVFDEALRRAACLADLIQQNTSSSCYQYSDSTNCSSTNSGIVPDFELLQNSLMTLKPPEIICKDVNEVTLFLNDTTFSVNFLEFHTEFFQENHTFTTPTTCNTWVLNDLKPNSTYNIRRWKMWIKNDSYFLEFSNVTLVIMTDRSSKNLFPIPDLTVKNLTLNGTFYDAVVSWTPASDMPCLYTLDAFGVTIGKHVYKSIALDFNENEDSYSQFEKPYKRFPPYEEKLSGLHFGNKYNITVRGIDHNFITESPRAHVTIEVPSCLDTFFNLSICDPPKVEDIVASTKCDVETETCDLIISWSTPKLVPEKYMIYAFSTKKGGNYFRNFTVSGMANSTNLTNLPTGTYNIVIRAVSETGNLGESTTIEESLILTADDFNANVAKKLAIALPVLIIVAIAIVVLFIILKRRNIGNVERKENNIYTELLRLVISKKPDVVKMKDEWEIPAENVTFERIIGEGAFGLVRKGILKKNNGESIEVGIKMLKPHATAEDVCQLYQEMAIMISVGSHPNLVSIIGRVTETVDRPLLVVEYCPNGDLQSFLRKEWERFNNFYRNTNQATNEEDCYNVFNKVYAFNNCEGFLTPTDLLLFARQITLGMEYLSSLRVIHRDLAARNVLVCDNKLVKVSDFGLSRDVYENNIYCKQGAGRLPMRWMALESLTHQIYTTESDVWSFGVLLWEIVTFGQYPYPEVSNADLLTFLKKGQRMVKPPHCGTELYRIMLDCWKENPKNRPTFTELKETLDDLLEDALNYVKM